MKKLMSMILALTMVFTLAACGSEDAPESGAAESVDLNAFYAELAETYEWIADDADMSDASENAVMMMDLTSDPEFMENYYAGIGEIAAKQLVAHATLMSFAVDEYVFAECETEEDAGKLAEILQARIDTQIEGGAMYPMSIEAWEKAEVVTNGSYVALVASGEHQDAIVDAFNALFA